MALRHSYVYLILKFLRNRQALTAFELFQLLTEERESLLSREGKRLVGPKTIRDMREALEGLAEIGVVYLDGEKVRLAENIPPPPTDGGDGDGGGNEPGGPNGPEGDGGGVGLSEILGHDVLFCLSDGEQDALLDGAFNSGDKGQE